VQLTVQNFCKSTQYKGAGAARPRQLSPSPHSTARHTGVETKHNACGRNARHKVLTQHTPCGITQGVRPKPTPYRPHSQCNSAQSLPDTQQQLLNNQSTHRRNERYHPLGEGYDQLLYTGRCKASARLLPEPERCVYVCENPCPRVHSCLAMPANSNFTQHHAQCLLAKVSWLHTRQGPNNLQTWTTPPQPVIRSSADTCDTLTWKQ
jgi:hypothetical protein